MAVEGQEEEEEEEVALVVAAAAAAAAALGVREGGSFISQKELSSSIRRESWMLQMCS